MVMDLRLIETGLFWLLLVLVLQPFSLEWSLLAYLLIAHLDMSGPEWASASSIGWENTVKIIALPTVLLLRTRLKAWRLVKGSIAFRIWMAFGLYAVVASLWTPFPVSAIKLIGYLYSYTVTFLVFAYAFSKDRTAMYKIVLRGLWFSLLLAVLQTYFLGNFFGTSEDRFTSFSSPQSFAAYLVCGLALVLLGAEHGVKKLSLGFFVCFVVMMALLLNGSNTMFLGMLIVITFWVGAWLVSKPSFVRVMQFHFIGILAVAGLMLSILLPNILAVSRATTTIYAVIARDMSITDIGTFAWRLSIYRALKEVISKTGMLSVILGHGTSSGASIMLRYFGYYPSTVDANRVIHNEWLRIIYEWGVVGLLLFGSFMLALVIGALFARPADRKLCWPFLSVAPMLLALLFVENVLASAGTPEGVGLVLIVAAMVRERSNHRQSGGT